MRGSGDGLRALVKAFRPMPDPADYDARTHDTLNALSVACAQVQLIQRRLARGPYDPAAMDGALAQVERSLDRLRNTLHRIDAPDPRPPAGPFLSLSGWDGGSLG